MHSLSGGLASISIVLLPGIPFTVSLVAHLAWSPQQLSSPRARKFIPGKIHLIGVINGRHAPPDLWTGLDSAWHACRDPASWHWMRSQSVNWHWGVMMEWSFQAPARGVPHVRYTHTWASPQCHTLCLSVSDSLMLILHGLAANQQPLISLFDFEVAISKVIGVTPLL